MAPHQKLSAQKKGRRKPEQKPPSLLQRILRFFGLGTGSPSPSASSSGAKAARAAKIPVSSERLFIGNLSYTVTGEDLENLFKKAGTVVKAEVAANQKTNRSKGFGFVTMATVEEARRAVEKLDGWDLAGRPISVSGSKGDRSSQAQPPDSEARHGRKTRDRREKSSERGRDQSESEEWLPSASPQPVGQVRERREPRERRERRDSGERAGRREGRNREKRRDRSRSRDRDGDFSGSRPAVVPVKTPVVTSPRLVLSNLSPEFQDSDLPYLFEGIGKVIQSERTDSQLIVEMGSVEEAQQAVRFLDGKDFMGLMLKIAEAPGNPA